MKPTLVKKGSVIIRIYTGADGTFTVVWYEPTGLPRPKRRLARKRFGAGQFDKAKDFADDKASKIANAETSAYNLTPADCVQFVRFREICQGIPKPLELIAAEYADAYRKLGVPLNEAVTYYNRHHEGVISNLNVRAIVDEMVAAKKDEELSDSWIEDLTSRCGRFADDFQCPLSEIATRQIVDWLRGLSVRQKTVKNYIICLRTLYSYAKVTGRLPRAWQEMDDVPVPDPKRGDIEIFTPEEMEALLQAALAMDQQRPQKMIPFLATGAFAGLRHADLKRARWGKFNFISGWLTVDRSITKTNRRRLVPILPNLATWLLPYAKQSGFICDFETTENQLAKISQRAGVPWKHNALRHSFISYRLADIKDEAQVAVEAGNSVEECRESYLQLVSPDDAKRWFDICHKSFTIFQVA